MALRDWFTKKEILVEELADMYTRDDKPEMKEYSQEYWSKESKHTVIGQIDFLMQTKGKHWCTTCGWTDEPCDC